MKASKFIKGLLHHEDAEDLEVGLDELIERANLPFARTAQPAEGTKGFGNALTGALAQAAGKGPAHTPDHAHSTGTATPHSPASALSHPHAHNWIWLPDILGNGYEATTLNLGTDDEGEVVATLVRYQPDKSERSARAVLYVHGWNDYFFQRETAEFWHAQGVSFYAVDLRKYGRSLREWQTPGYTDSLSVYAQDLAAALAVIKDELGQHTSIMLMGHSTGGLITSLFLHYNPDAASGLILNSPWLELQGSAIVRTLSTPALTQMARIQPKAPLPDIDAGFFSRTVSKEYGGEWEYNTQWRPTPSFPVRPGWLAAIVTGHARVARGLDIRVPVLVLASDKTTISARWNEAMRSSDSVLDVEPIARRAVQLGQNVTVSRIAGGIHDLSLSPRPIRDHYFESIRLWTMAYGWLGKFPVEERAASIQVPVIHGEEPPQGS